MSNNITQSNINRELLEGTIGWFFKRFRICSVLKAVNAYKAKGVSPVEIFQYLVTLVFSNRTMYMDMIASHGANFAKDTVYRFMNEPRINWLRFTTLLASRIIKKSIAPLTSDERVNVLIADDSTYERGRSLKVELLATTYDHVKQKYSRGFRLLTLGWSDGNTFIPVNGVLLSSANKKNRINEAVAFDKRTLGYKRRVIATQKAPCVLLELLRLAKKAAIPAKYVLFDSWFTSQSMLIAIKSLGYDVIGMVKKTPKSLFRYKGEKMTIEAIYKRNKKRPGKSKYLLSVTVDVEKDDQSIPAKLVYVRNKGRKGEYLVLICTDMELCEDEIKRIYGKRWDIELSFKVFKSKLKLTTECHSLSYDALTAHAAIVFTRYMILALGSRESNDGRSIGALFINVADEMADITLMEALALLLQLFTPTLKEYTALSEERVSSLLDKFIDTLPEVLKKPLQAA